MDSATAAVIVVVIVLFTLLIALGIGLYKRPDLQAKWFGRIIYSNSEQQIAAAARRRDPAARSLSDADEGNAPTWLAFGRN